MYFHNCHHEELASVLNFQHDHPLTAGPTTVVKCVRKFLAALPIASPSRDEREAAIFAECAEG